MRCFCFKGVVKMLHETRVKEIIIQKKKQVQATGVKLFILLVI